MDRRGYLRALGVTSAATAGLAGCLGRATSHTTLDKPEREVSSKQLPYLAWNERIPAVSLPAPLEDHEVTLRSDVETPSLITFFFSHCRTVCPVLISTLRSVQTHALNHDYIDSVSFLPITFDPQRDDADRLRTYAKNMHIDRDANWHFLRPGSKHRAKRVIHEKFGVTFDRQPRKHGDGYMFIHTPLILLVGADGYVERAYRTTSPSAETIIEDLSKLR
jgi:protein SCO1/2